MLMLMLLLLLLLLLLLGSVDARGKYMKDAQHWTDSTMLNGRAHLRATSDKVRLVLDPVRNSDEGVYKCRVDFKKSPTRNSRTHLTVISEQPRPFSLSLGFVSLSVMSTTGSSRSSSRFLKRVIKRECD